MHRWSSIRWTVLTLSLAVLVCGGGILAGRLRAQQSGGSPSPYYVITFVDLIPPGKDAGVALLKQYVDNTRKAPGIQRAEALTQISRPNLLCCSQSRKARTAPPWIAP